MKPPATTPPSRAVTVDLQPMQPKKFLTLEDLRSIRLAEEATALLSIGGKALNGGSAIGVVGDLREIESQVALGIGMHLAAGKPWHHINPARPLRVQVIFAGEDKGDIAELFGESTFDFNASQRQHLMSNLVAHTVNDKIGVGLCDWLSDLLTDTQDEVVILSPFSSFRGCAGNRHAVAQFLRSTFYPVIQSTGAIAFMMNQYDAASLEKGLRFCRPKTSRKWDSVASDQLPIHEIDFTCRGRLLKTDAR